MAGSVVDPRMPRVGAAITATLALVAVATRSSVVIALLATLLLAPLATGWRVDPYASLWRNVLQGRASPPPEYERAIPHRFARAFGAGLLAIAAALSIAADLTDAALLSPAIALVATVGILAAVTAITGVCLGCRLYDRIDPERPSGLLTSPEDR